VLLMFAAGAAAGSSAGVPDMPRFRWENFTTENGLPDNHVFQIKVDGNRVWAATENGLALYENGRWKVYGTADGLVHRAVLCVDVDPKTGDVWAATMGGLSRFSAGRFDNYTQLNSGLPNDVVYGVASKATGSGWPPPPGARASTSRPDNGGTSTNATLPCTRFGLTPSPPEPRRSTTRCGAAACWSTT